MILPSSLPLNYPFIHVSGYIILYVPAIHPMFKRLPRFQRSWHCRTHSFYLLCFQFSLISSRLQELLRSGDQAANDITRRNLRLKIVIDCFRNLMKPVVSWLLFPIAKSTLAQSACAKVLNMCACDQPVMAWNNTETFFQMASLTVKATTIILTCEGTKSANWLAKYLHIAGRWMVSIDQSNEWIAKTNFELTFYRMIPRLVWFSAQVSIPYSHIFSGIKDKFNWSYIHVVVMMKYDEFIVS